MRKLKLWHIIVGAVCVLCLTVSLILYLNCRSRISDLDHQALAARWSEEGGYAQESVFYTDSAGVSAEDVASVRRSVDTALVTASIEGSYEERSWLDAYSTDLSMTLTVDNGAKCDVTMTAVGGDFFLFHPMHLIGGSYISESDLMHDLVVIDRLTAWNLYGSVDCVGMKLYINSLPYIVAGVVESVDGDANLLAAASTPRAYMAFDTAGAELKSGCYEALLPNPIPGFAQDTLTKALGADDSSSVAVENTHRFSVENIFTLLGNMPTRSMQTISISYPYWENAARLTETRLAFEYFAVAVLLSIPAICLIILIVVLWRRKKWRFKDVKNSIGDKIYGASCRRAAGKKSNKRRPQHLKVRNSKNEKTSVFDEHSADSGDDSRSDRV